MLTARRSHARPAPEAPSIAPGTLPRAYAHLSCGRVAYLRHGSGSPLVLVHGIPTSARLWEPLLGDLGEHFDCIVPDLLGLGESVPAPGTDLASPGQADMIAQLLDHLGIERAALAAHDQGGAHAQQVLVRHGQRVTAVAFCGVVCFDNWPVPVIEATMRLGRWPGLVGALGRAGIPQAAFVKVALPQAIGRGHVDPVLIKEWFGPLSAGRERLELWLRYFRAQSPAWTTGAVPALQAWTKPALVMWAAGDAYLPASWGVQLARTIPGAADTPTLLPFAGHFWQCDCPREGARHLIAFFSASVPPERRAPGDVASGEQPRARASSRLRFEVYTGAKGGHLWRLLASNGQTVAGSGETFASASNAKRAAEAFKANAAASTFEVYADAGGRFRWRAVAKNGQTVGSSGQAFASRSSARRAAGNVHTRVADADL